MSLQNHHRDSDHIADEMTAWIVPMLDKSREPVIDMARERGVQNSRITVQEVRERRPRELRKSIHEIQ